MSNVSVQLNQNKRYQTHLLKQNFYYLLFISEKNVDLFPQIKVASTENEWMELVKTMELWAKQRSKFAAFLKSMSMLN